MSHLPVPLLTKKLLLSAALIFSCASLYAARPEPQMQVDAFFKTLGEKDASAAVAGLCDGTFLKTQKADQIVAMPVQLENGIKIYGKVERVENVDKKLYGESFVRLRLISYQAIGAPLFWEFQFLKVKGEWQVWVFRFSDQFGAVFGEKS